MNVQVLAAEGPLPVLPHTSELIVGVVAFGILFFLLWKFGAPQFEAIYQARTDAIEGGIKRAEEAKAEADELKAQYDEQLAGLRAEAARIRDDARAEGAQIKSELRAQAEEEAARILAQAEERIAAARSAAERDLRGQIGGLSVQLAQRIVGDSLADETRRSATIDSFLAELDSTATRSGAAQPTGAS